LTPNWHAFLPKMRNGKPSSTRHSLVKFSTKGPAPTDQAKDCAISFALEIHTAHSPGVESEVIDANSTTSRHSPPVPRRGQICTRYVNITTI